MDHIEKAKWAYEATRLKLELAQKEEALAWSKYCLAITIPYPLEGRRRGIEEAMPVNLDQWRV